MWRLLNGNTRFVIEATRLNPHQEITSLLPSKHFHSNSIHHHKPDKHSNQIGVYFQKRGTFVGDFPKGMTYIRQWKEIGDAF